VKLKFKNIINRYLDLIEKVANKLPDPFFLFLILALSILVISSILSSLGTSVIHPVSLENIKIINLLTKAGFQDILTKMVDNFINFPPLGVVLAAMIGIGLAEQSGFFSAALKHTILRFPSYLMVPAIAFISVNSSLISDAGIVVIPPLSGLIFHAAGRNPIAGILLSFTAVVGGYSANLSVTALDPLLSELTQNAAKEIDSNYEVYATANYYFMVFSVFLVTALSTFINNKIVEPRLGKIESDDGQAFDTDTGNKALWFSYLFILFCIILVVVLALTESSIFRDSDGSLKILYKSIIPLIIIIFGGSGVIYGFLSGGVRRLKDLVDLMTKSMNQMGVYLLLAFAAGQFIAYFDWSNLGIVIAIKGANLIQSFGLEGLPIIGIFLVFSLILNLFMASASAKWTIIAPVFVPMLMILGWSPEITQLVYRIADSSTNMITPLLPYFPLIIIFTKKYDKDITIGKLISSLLPYSIAFIIIWSLVLFLWIALEIPIGPEVELYYKG
jgi:aminobenzoyl-glutamate transport protein